MPRRSTRCSCPPPAARATGATAARYRRSPTRDHRAHRPMTRAEHQRARVARLRRARAEHEHPARASGTAVRAPNHYAARCSRSALAAGQHQRAARRTVLRPASTLAAPPAPLVPLPTLIVTAPPEPPVAAPEDQNRARHPPFECPSSARACPTRPSGPAFALRSPLAARARRPLASRYDKPLTPPTPPPVDTVLLTASRSPLRRRHASRCRRSRSARRPCRPSPRPTHRQRPRIAQSSACPS